MKWAEKGISIFYIPNASIARMTFGQNANSRCNSYAIKAAHMFYFFFHIITPSMYNCGLLTANRSNNSFCLRLISQTIRDTCSQHPSRRSIGNDEQLIHLMEISSLYGSHRAALIAWFPDQGVLWLDGSIIILTRFIAISESYFEFWSRIFLARSFKVLAYGFCGCRDFMPAVWLTYSRCCIFSFQVSWKKLLFLSLV